MHYTHSDPVTALAIEARLAAVRRSTIVDVLRRHPNLPLAELLRCNVDLCDVTVGDLLTSLAEPARVPLARARARGPKFDALVLELLTDADEPVGAGYLRTRVGGPRWKLLSSLRRLIAAGDVARSGATSGTLYRAVAR